MESVNFQVSASQTAVSGAVHECLALTSLHEVAVCPTDSYRCTDADGAPVAESESVSTPPKDYLGDGIVQIEGSGR